MIFKQYYLGCLAHASYLVADEGSQVAAVVDPQRDVDQYLEDAAQHGVEIRHVLLTHQHADFIAGHLELRDRVGATIHLGARAKAEYRFTPMKDGDTVRLGADVTLQVLETAGHTPESISILVFDAQAGRGARKDPEPWAVLTGDTLFVNDVGRPDLRAALGWAPQDLAAMLYDSLHGKLLSLPGATRVYPAHGAGSLCGKALGPENSSTMEIQRRVNYALQPMSKDEFVRMVMADQPEAPPYFTYDAVLNTKDRLTLDKTLEKSLKPFTLEAVLQVQEEGGQLLDVRAPASFEAGHLAGSLNISLEGQYATWAGTLLDHERPIVVIADPGREYEAVMRLGRIGFDSVVGYLAGGMQTVTARPELAVRTEGISPEALAKELTQAPSPFLLDVRAVREWKQGAIEGNVNIPLNHLAERIAEVPRGRRIVVYCAGGYRSSAGASLLKQYGFDDVAHLSGGIRAWWAAQTAPQMSPVGAQFGAATGRRDASR
jgi:glyoxylase-like metal-dependent hydrolase (beta-lactamase superfamily II)/rhodanese-related sulfurtransferase